MIVLAVERSAREKAEAERDAALAACAEWQRAMDYAINNLLCNACGDKDCDLNGDWQKCGAYEHLVSMLPSPSPGQAFLARLAAVTEALEDVFRRCEHCDDREYWVAQDASDMCGGWKVAHGLLSTSDLGQAFLAKLATYRETLEAVVSRACRRCPVYSDRVGDDDGGPAGCPGWPLAASCSQFDLTILRAPNPAAPMLARLKAGEAALEAGHRLAPYLGMLLDPEADAAKVKYTSPQLKELIRGFIDALTAHHREASPHV
jgi:hypothetical protein